MSVLLIVIALSSLLVAPAAAQEAPIFSGPQVGEILPPVTMRNVLGPNADEETDLVTEAGGRPILLIFVHERTRPAFGLANLLTRYAVTRESTGLHRGLIFLTDDATVTETWMKNISDYFEKETPVGISIDGAEGPGAYGLNRNVALTILVGKEGRTTANFALVQPSIQADGPKILKAVVDVTGGGDVPDIATLAPEGMRNRMQPKSQRTSDAKLEGLIRALIQKEASEEQVARAAKAIDAYVKENEAARKELGRITTTVVNSGKLDNYGTKAAQDKLKEWAQAHGAGRQGSREPEQEKNTPSPSSEES